MTIATPPQPNQTPGQRRTRPARSPLRQTSADEVRTLREASDRVSTPAAPPTTRDVTIPVSLLALVLGIVAVGIAFSAAQSPGNNPSGAAAPAAGRHTMRMPTTGDAAPATSSTSTAATTAAKTAASKLPVQDGTLDTLEPTKVDGNHVTFELDARPVTVNLGDGKTFEGYGYNGQVPGPTLDVHEGDHVTVQFTNHLPEATSVHWHGLDVANDADGVPGLTQSAVKPGGSYTYDFTATPAGTHFYHTHGSGTHGQEAGQMDKGLAGAIIVHPRSEAAADIDLPLLLGGGMQGSYTLNGAVFPHTAPVVAHRGDLIRLRMINVGSSAIHPMHVHGHQVRIVALDGNPVPRAVQQLRDTVTLNAGETADIEFRAYNPGKWVIHCHDLNHVSGGMAMPFTVT